MFEQQCFLHYCFAHHQICWRERIVVVFDSVNKHTEFIWTLVIFLPNTFQHLNFIFNIQDPDYSNMIISYTSDRRFLAFCHFQTLDVSQFCVINRFAGLNSTRVSGKILYLIREQQLLV